jgi:hypothetical protein
MTLLHERLRDTPLDERLSPLHIAALVGYVDEVERLVVEDPTRTTSVDARGYTPFGLLLREVSHSQPNADTDYQARVKDVLRCLVMHNIKADRTVRNLI